MADKPFQEKRHINRLQVLFFFSSKMIGYLQICRYILQLTR